MTLRPTGSSGLHAPLTNTIENTRNTAASVYIQFHYFPILIIFLIVLGFLLDFSFYFIENRIGNEIPTIEEMQTSFPNDSINSIFKSIAAFFLIFLLTLYISATCIIDYRNRFLILFSRFISILCPIFQILSSVINIEINAKTNFILMSLYFVSLIAFFILSIFLSKNDTNKKKFLLKLFLLVAIVVSFVLYFTTSNLFSNTWSPTLHSVGQLLFYIFSASFIILWIKQLSIFRLQIVLLND